MPSQPTPRDRGRSGAPREPGAWDAVLDDVLALRFGACERCGSLRVPRAVADDVSSVDVVCPAGCRQAREVRWSVPERPVKYRLLLDLLTGPAPAVRDDAGAHARGETAEDRS